jgi:hypothetical protein
LARRRSVDWSGVLGIQGGHVVTDPPEYKEANMSENVGGAGPAIAAHSKDGSAAGQTAASGVTTQPKQPEPSGEYLGRLAAQLGDLVRQEPLIAAAVTGVVGLCVGMMLSRR